MSDHMTHDQIERYGKKRLMPGEWAGASDHINACETCAQDIRASFPVATGGPLLFGNAVSKEETGPEHLTFEEMETYLDKREDAFLQEIVETHIDYCQMCKDDLEALRQVRLELVDAERTVPVSPVPDDVVAAAPVKSESFWTRLRAAWTDKTDKRKWAPPVFGGMGAFAGAAATLLIGVLWWHPLQVQGGSGTNTGHDASSLAKPQELARLQQERDRALAAKSEAETRIAQQDKKLQQIAKTTSAQQLKIDRLLAEQRAQAAAMKQQQDLQGTNAAIAHLELPSQDGRIAALNPVPTHLMGNDSGEKHGENFFLLRPYGTLLSSRQPIFSWSPVAGVKKYKVRVLHSGGLCAAAFLVEKSDGWYVQLLKPETADEDNPQTISEYLNPLASGTDWQLPEQWNLQYGESYSWDVMAYRKAVDPKTEGTDAKEQEIPSQVPERSEARFAVLNQDQISQLSQLRQQLAKQPLKLCQIYLKLGLLSEAEETLKGYLQNQPTSKAGRQLLLELTKKRAMRTKN